MPICQSVEGDRDEGRFVGCHWTWAPWQWLVKSLHTVANDG